MLSGMDLAPQLTPAPHRPRSAGARPTSESPAWGRASPPDGRAPGWPLSLGLQLVEIEALARLDRRRARRWGLLGAGIFALAVALVVLSCVVAGPAAPAGATAVLAVLAGALALGAGSAAGGALGSLRSARRRDAEAFTRQLRGGGGPGPVSMPVGGMTGGVGGPPGERTDQRGENLQRRENM